MAHEEPDRFIPILSLVAGLTAFAAGGAASLAAAWAAAGFGNPLRQSLVLDLGLAASAVSGLLAGAAVAVFLQRPAARFGRILAAARQMAEGDLASRAPEGTDLAGRIGRFLNAVAGRGAHLLSSVRREHGQLNRQVAVLRAASIRNRERAAQERVRLSSATAAVGGLDGTIRAIAESVETLAAGSEETAAAVAEVDGSLTQLLARSEGLLVDSTDGAGAAASLAEGAAVLDATLSDLARRADDLAEGSAQAERAQTASRTAPSSRRRERPRSRPRTPPRTPARGGPSSRRRAPPSRRSACRPGQCARRSGASRLAPARWAGSSRCSRTSPGRRTSSP